MRLDRSNWLPADPNVTVVVAQLLLTNSVDAYFEEQRAMSFGEQVKRVAHYLKRSSVICTKYID